MRYGPDTDRLAVWTYTEAGEEIPCGDPSVTDAERAAAGRQTLAQRFQDLMEPNRRRAAEQYAAGGLPDGQDVARIWCPRDPAVLRARLGAASRFGVTEGPWAAAGFSNGGAWAIAAAQRRPDLFTAVAALSVGMAPRQLTRQARTTRVRHYLAAGILETGFRTATRQWAERLQRARLPCHYQEWVGGHDPYWWEQQLPSALAWLLAPP